jgi:hypothetical protein
MRIKHVEDIEVLREVGEYWLAEHRGAEYGFNVNVDAIIADSKEWLATGQGTVIALYDEDPGYVGFMTVYCTREFMGDHVIAFEKYWYVMPSYRSGALQMLHTAEFWAKQQGATHLVLSASAMASDMYDNLCALYERLNMRVFEKSYISEL